jgi:hypothetical protein
VPTETGLSLFGVLKQADPALVDPGVTVQLECLLDDVVDPVAQLASAASQALSQHKREAAIERNFELYAGPVACAGASSSSGGRV